MNDELVIQFLESKISVTKLIELKSILAEYPGSSTVVLRIIKDFSDNSSALLELKSIKVSPSLDLMLDLFEFMA